MGSFETGDFQAQNSSQSPFMKGRRNRLNLFFINLLEGLKYKNGEFQRGEAPQTNPHPSPLKERGTQGVRMIKYKEV
ncbi:MAG: hypothetical protein AMJ70_03420 [Dehalococcoidia bacterium SG8_51_3]|nr:MAG: hypothetical protein AMJ70_03420 [Dehalococcoidia bacterium SG8_51_3]